MLAAAVYSGWLGASRSGARGERVRKKGNVAAGSPGRENLGGGDSGKVHTGGCAPGFICPGTRARGRVWLGSPDGPRTSRWTTNQHSTANSGLRETQGEHSRRDGDSVRQDSAQVARLRGRRPGSGLGGERSVHEPDRHRAGEVSGDKQAVPWWILRGEGPSPGRALAGTIPCPSDTPGGYTTQSRFQSRLLIRKAPNPAHTTKQAISAHPRKKKGNPWIFTGCLVGWRRRVGIYSTFFVPPSDSRACGFAESVVPVWVPVASDASPSTAARRCASSTRTYRRVVR